MSPLLSRALWRAQATLHVVVATAFDSGEGADGKGRSSSFRRAVRHLPVTRCQVVHRAHHPGRDGTGVMGAGRLVRRTVPAGCGGSSPQTDAGTAGVSRVWRGEIFLECQKPRLVRMPARAAMMKAAMAPSRARWPISQKA